MCTCRAQIRNDSPPTVSEERGSQVKSNVSEREEAEESLSSFSSESV